MTFHCVSLPHTQTTRAWSNCAFTENVRKFCILAKGLGHRVILYASEDNEAPCDELVTCITKKEQLATCGVDGPSTVLNARYEADKPHWRLFNQRVIEAMRVRVIDRDFLALIAGDLNQPVIDAFPQVLPIEHAVGYTGISGSTKRAFASYAWMHAVYGKFYGAHACPGRFYDRVIPHYIDPADFPNPAVLLTDDYFLFVGRLNEDKGVRIAAQVAKTLGTKLVVAGQGPIVPEGCDYRGLVGPVERAELMAKAKALFVPSTYLEPFGMVAIEGMMAGTPLITTDWGGLSEINIHGSTGFKCHTLQDFVEAARRVGEIDRARCRRIAESKYTIAAVTPLYQKWFDDLHLLWTTGWETLSS
jgi:glycosyltransferase involved in cell wall biosynthesis